MGSDGIFDNLFEPEILQCLKTSGDLVDVDAAAICLADRALVMSKDEHFESPFSIGARKAGKNHPGGKEDDITVIVSRVNLN
jgi:protein phosphatase PTC7